MKVRELEAPCPHKYEDCAGTQCLYPWKCKRYAPDLFRKKKDDEPKKKPLPDFLK